MASAISGNAARISAEIEKLSLYAGTDRPVSEEDIWNLTPNARASTIFALVNAIGRRDRTAALESLDVLVPDYLDAVPSGTQIQAFRYMRVDESYQLSFSYVGPGMNNCDYTPEAGEWDCSGYY